MTGLQKRLVFIGAVICLCAWRTTPTVEWLRLGVNGQDQLKEQDPDRHSHLQDSAMMLGLDLQGGMHLILEVDVEGAVQSQFEDQLADLRTELNKDGIPLDGIEERDEMEYILTPKDPEKDTDRIIQITNPYQVLTAEATDEGILIGVERRLIDQQMDFITRQALETLRDRVDQFGVSEPVIQRQGQNRIIVDLAGIRDKDQALELIGRTAALEFRLVVKDKELQDSVKKLERVLGDSFSSALIKGQPISYFVPIHENKVEETAQLLQRPEAKAAIRHDLEFLWGTPDPDLTGIPLYLAERRAPLTGMYLIDAVPHIGGGDAGQNVVWIRFNRRGASLFERITGENVLEHLAIVLDDEVQSAPRIENKIAGGNAEIRGNFTPEQAANLALILQAGALPADVRIVQQTFVGPSLGADSVKKGFLAGAVGLALVFLFMMIYYRLSGVVAALVLALNIVIIMGVMAGFRATLTLPGIAGLILTMGMAVDANVLIYERIREEAESGKTLRSAIENGFSKAFLTIFDANLTTLITGLILYNVGTGPIKGFALTLCIGIVSSVFSALYICKAFFELLCSLNLLKGIHMFRLLGASNYPLVPFRRKAFLLSGGCLILGLGYFAVRGQDNLGVDFTGGNLMHLTFKEPVSTEQLRGALSSLQTEDRQNLEEFQIQMIGGAGDRAIVRTPELSQKTELNLTFQRPLRPADVKQALEETSSARFDFPEGEARKQTFKVKLYGPVSSHFLESVKRILPELELSQSQVNQSGDVFDQLAKQLPQTDRERSRIESIGAVVGKDMKLKAVWAISWALGAILLYIWIRFELEFALGAVLALFHDVCFTIGLFSLLQRELSLAVVASLLTIIGYSLNDTIVVYDRIRENLRLSKRQPLEQLVNSSINQTLSRTVLTSTTTLLVVLSLCLFGGEVIRDFSLTLLIGVAIGTYSSIAIASSLIVEWRTRQKG